MTTAESGPGEEPVRLCLPYEDLQQGGMFSFMRNFRRFLDSHGIEHTTDLAAQASVLVANSWVLGYQEVLEAKRRNPGLRVLHRIDGSARNYGRDPVADRYQSLVNRLADVTVYQSEYGRRITHLELGIIEQDGPVIYNPVDLVRFSPDGEKVPLEGDVRIVNVTFSKNPRKGTATLYRIAADNPDIDFHLIGQYEEPPSLGNVHLLGHLDWSRLPAALRSCHYFVTFSESETCPNVVLEAMSSGLPVLYKDSGGIPELVGETGVAVTPDDFRKILDGVHPRRAALARSARERASRLFDPDTIFSRYLDAGVGARRRPLPGILSQLIHRLYSRFSR